MKSNRGIFAACFPSLWLLATAHVACSEEARPRAVASNGSSSPYVPGSSSGGGGKGGSDSTNGGEGGSGSDEGPGGADFGSGGAPSAEICGDGNDNDQDGDTDCSDADCEERCENPCLEPDTLEDPAEVHASTIGRKNVLSSICSENAESPGPDAVYRLVAAHTGRLELEIASGALVHVTVVESCSATETVDTCTTDLSSVPVTQGDELFLVVESHSSADAGDFMLRARTRELDVCGDGYRDPEESCDDQNLLPDDGCSAACELESTEIEPNGAAANATSYEDGFVGEIADADDEDLVRIELPPGRSSITAELLGFGSDCARYSLDSALELASGEALTPLASDDDSGEGFCSRLVEAGLDGGSYYVKVLAAADAETPFPYRLRVTVNHCGDGVLGPGEACDDGDTEAGDGCSATCEIE